MLKKNSRLLGASQFHFWLEDGRGTGSLISGRENCGENDPDRGDSFFIRVYGGGVVVFRVSFSPELKAAKAFLHGDLAANRRQDQGPDGGEAAGAWGFVSMTQDGEGSFRYSMELPRGGYFSFRLAAALTVITEEGQEQEELAWEPWPYHKLMIDPPALRCLKLYTLIPTVSGDISQWSRDLENIKALGFNAVHILPFTSMGPSESPYSAENLFSIDAAYLNAPDDFDRFVDKALELGIALCFDIVLNHVSTSSFLARSKAHWLQPDCRRPDGLKRAGAWHMNLWISWEDLVLINYDHPDPVIRREIFDYMKDYLMYWGRIALKTGGFIRLDNLHSSHRGFINWILDEMRREAPGLAVLSEFFGANETLRKGVGRWGLNLLMANTWEYPFAPQFRDYLRHVHASSHAVRYLLEPTSHDTPAAAELFASPLSAIPRYFCCALMGTGQTGIVQGYELGLPEKINFIGRQGRVELRGQLDLRPFLSQVNRLMEDHPVFLAWDNIEFLDVPKDSLVAALRRGEGAGYETAPAEGWYLLAANFDTGNGCDYFFEFPAGAAGEAEPLLLERAAAEISDKKIHIRLEACGAAAFRF